MRHRARVAAVTLAALALAAAGCSDLVSSLTPFGIGNREPDPVVGTYSGSWLGTTNASGVVTFTVVSGEVTDLVLTHQLSCGIVMEFAFDALLIENGEFTAELALEPQGRVVLAGRFASPRSCTASYSFESLPTSASCERSGGGSFTAEKVTQANP
jgi:hypothetical protein